MSQQTVTLAVDTTEVQALIAEMSALLDSAPQPIADELLERFHGLLSGDGNCELLPTPIAGENVFRLQVRIRGYDEFLAAARLALQADSFCTHEAPHAK